MAKSNPLHSLRPRVLALLRTQPERSLAFQTIRESLNLTRGHDRALQALLDEMVRDGQVRTRNRRFALPQAEIRAAAQAAGGAVGKPPAPAPRRDEEILNGVYIGHRRGFGFVDLDEQRRSVFIPPGRAGGALDGDRVQVAVRRERGGNRFEGEVLAVLARFRNRMRGRIELVPHEAWVMPLNEKLPAVFLGTAAPKGMKAGDLVEVRIEQFPQDDDEAPAGRVLERIADDDDPERIIDHILADNQFLPGFSPEAEEEAERAAARPITPKGREDLRELPFVTIDGEDARDFDDAVCLLPLKGGRQRLLVAIADVAHYVTPGTTLDLEAYTKGTSVYLPHRALPMLPEVLSTDVCSLRPHEPRNSMTCDMELDGSGAVHRYRIYDSLIRSRARLTYRQVQTFFETGQPEQLPEPQVADMLARMRAFAAVLRERRKARGALSLILPESRFELNERGWPVAVQQSYPTEATQLIEQFMLEANEQVARHAETHHLPILYRVHDPPPPDQLEALGVILHNAGVEVRPQELQNGQGLNAVLERLKGHPQHDQLEISILRSMTQAQYRASNDGHFGLASAAYTHFTSPIRRYPDLLLHRALKRSWGGAREGKRGHGEPTADPSRLPREAGPHLSNCERLASSIEQQVQRLFKVLLMESQLGETFNGTVTGLSEYGLWVEMGDWHVDGLLPIDSLPEDRYRLERGRSLLRGLRTRREVGVGAKLTVQLARADRHTQTLELAFLKWGWAQPGESVKPAAPSHGKRRKRR